MTIYEDVSCTSFLNSKVAKKIQPYLLPLEHPFNKELDTLFSQYRVTHDLKEAVRAGFILLAEMPRSKICVARHPKFPEVIFKMYFDSQKYGREKKPCWKYLAYRCKIARKIQKKIEEKGIKHFVVPDKWLYPIPPGPKAYGKYAQPVILIETDMKVYDKKSSKEAWKTVVTEEHLRELYSVLKHGYGATSVYDNIPYTKKGVFAFVDTERPHVPLPKKLKRICRYLSSEMSDYWIELTH